MAKRKNINYYGYMLTDHIKNNATVFYMAAVAIVLGAVLGIILLCGQKSYIGMLTSSNQTLIKYMSGSAEVMHLFYSRLFSGVLAILVLFVLSLWYYSLFLCYVYLAYQGMLCTITLGTIISINGFSGILNVLLLLLPCNLLLFAVYALILSVLSSRVKLQHKYKLNFIDSFNRNKFWQLFLIFMLAYLCVNLVLGLIVPLIIKATFVIIY